MDDRIRQPSIKGVSGTKGLVKKEKDEEQRGVDEMSDRSADRHTV